MASLSVYAVAGQRIFIGSAPVDLPDVDLVASDFDTVTWVEIKNWSQMGGNGDAAALITTPLIDRNRDIKQKGTRNAGQMQNNFAIARTDPGQIAIRAAEAGDQNWPFKILGNDDPAVGSAPAPSQRLFYGLVTAATDAGGAANTAQMLNTTTEINSNIVTVAPTAGAVPVNTVKPAIAGLPVQGNVLTAYEGVWTGGVTSYTYQWKKGGVDIAGSTAKTKTVLVGEVGSALSVVVTAHNAAGTASATSGLTVNVT